MAEVERRLGILDAEAEVTELRPGSARPLPDQIAASGDQDAARKPAKHRARPSPPAEDGPHTEG